MTTRKNILTESVRHQAPLAYRMRPRDLDEFVGQVEIVGRGTILRQAIEEDRLSSLILYGPSGTGKTSLALVIANMTEAAFEQISAVTAGVKDIRLVIERAGERIETTGKRTILFIDEIHRFNKGQQDALLPAVEERTVVLIGATTENPFFEVNSPLISRSRIYVLKPLLNDELRKIIEHALADKERGLGGLKINWEKKAIEHIVSVANGDARKALNGLELAAGAGKGARARVTLKLAEEAMGRRALLYDKQGDAHYDTISAFIKSMRGGDPDASLYWLARMIVAGEDPKFIMRRMVIFASEDIGNADPRALQVATAAAQAVQFVGLPECRLNLAQAAVYLAVAPKSNAVIAGIDAALRDVEKERADPVPEHLRDAHYGGAKKLGHGQGYKYPHSYPGHWTEQEYLPENVRGRRYYNPSESGLEKSIREVLEKRRGRGEKRDS